MIAKAGAVGMLVFVAAMVGCQPTTAGGPVIATAPKPGWENGPAVGLAIPRIEFTSNDGSMRSVRGNADWIIIPPGETRVLLEEQDAGCITHFYWTYIDSCERSRLNIFRGLVLRAFWDNAPTPSIEVPLGDFFGSAPGLNAYAALGIAHVQLDVQPATPATFAAVLDGLARHRAAT